MNTFLLLVVLISGDGSEQLQRASDMRFSTEAECKAELLHYQNTETEMYFCGDANLYQKK